MDDTQQLIAIKEELERISDRLRKIFPSTHPHIVNQTYLLKMLPELY